MEDSLGEMPLFLTVTKAWHSVAYWLKLHNGDRCCGLEGKTAIYHTFIAYCSVHSSPSTFSFDPDPCQCILAGSKWSSNCFCTLYELKDKAQFLPLPPTWATQMELLTPDFALTNSWLFQVFGEWIGWWRISLSFFSHSVFQVHESKWVHFFFKKKKAYIMESYANIFF